MGVRVRDLDEARRILNGGGLLILPTDTVPGFHGRADSDSALDLIDRIKGRDPGRPLVCLASGPEQAAMVTADLTDGQKSLCSRCWPGPFSLILPAGPGLSTRVTGGRGTVAVRVPDFPWMQSLLDAVGFPLVSTSVNRTGDLPCENLDQAQREFAEEVQGVWAADVERAVPLEGSPGPSALIDATVSPPRILRPGPRALPPTA